MRRSRRGGFSWVLLSRPRGSCGRDGRWTRRAKLAASAESDLARFRGVRCRRSRKGRDRRPEGRDKDATKSLEEALGLAAAQPPETADSAGCPASTSISPLPRPPLRPPPSRSARSDRACRRGLFVSWPSPSRCRRPEARRNYAALASAADGLIAMVFGEHDRAKPATDDPSASRGGPAYSPDAEGRWKGRDGGENGDPSRGLPQAALRRSSAAALPARHGVEERAGFGYVFHAGAPFSWRSRRFGAGDEVIVPATVSSPTWSGRLSRDPAGRRFDAAGRVLRLLRLLGRRPHLHASPRSPRCCWADRWIRISASPSSRSSGTHHLAAENVSPMPSALSRTSNWIEVDLGRPGIRDVRNAGFDRYEVFGASGARVSLGRASRVRFFETLFGPVRKDPAGVDPVAPGLPPSCCRFRSTPLADGRPSSPPTGRRRQPPESNATGVLSGGRRGLESVGLRLLSPRRRGPGSFAAEEPDDLGRPARTRRRREPAPAGRESAGTRSPRRRRR